MHARQEEPLREAARLFEGKICGIVGLGKMGSAVIRGMVAAGLVTPAQFRGTTGHSRTREQAGASLGIQMRGDNATLALECDIIVVAVKPRNVRTVMREMRAALDPAKLLISIAAGVPMEIIAEEAGRSDIPIIRAMPNMCAAVMEGMTGFSLGQAVTDEHLAIAEAMFCSFGRAAQVDEHLLDAVTGLAASGPAFIFVIIESLAEAGVKVGLPRETALLMAEQMVLGSARLALETGEHPAKLKEDITTPAGTTIDGILELEEGKLRVTLIKAVVKATERAKELSRTL